MKIDIHPLKKQNKTENLQKQNSHTEQEWIRNIVRWNTIMN